MFGVGYGGGLFGYVILFGAGWWMDGWMDGGDEGLVDGVGI